MQTKNATGVIKTGSTAMRNERDEELNVVLRKRER